MPTQTFKSVGLILLGATLMFVTAGLTLGWESTCGISIIILVVGGGSALIAIGIDSLLDR